MDLWITYIIQHSWTLLVARSLSTDRYEEPVRGISQTKQGITRDILALCAIMVLARCASLYLNCRCIWADGYQTIM